MLATGKRGRNGPEGLGGLRRLVGTHGEAILVSLKPFN